ncbi:uncharacterized protein METZ01_LOCUS464072, partial [marine metagenome]
MLSTRLWESTIETTTPSAVKTHHLLRPGDLFACQQLRCHTGAMTRLRTLLAVLVVASGCGGCSETVTPAITAP